MQHDFWHQKWQDNKIGFHEAQANKLLTQNISKLALAKGAKIFIPLCGKTLDIDWLLTKDYSVVGAELSELAINQLFEQLNITPKTEQLDGLVRYYAPNISIYVGDIFNLTSEIIGKIDAIYDRAALVALPAKTRVDYANHMMKITRTAPQLLVCYEYDQNLMSGPPFSINAAEVQTHYANAYNITLSETDKATGKVKATENVWLLKPNEQI
ncbi:MAG: thiopurine S-methyltransferase [Hyphomicrobiales bacterium]